MKKTFLLMMFVGILLTACENGNEPYQFKAGEFVYLNGVEQPKFKSTTTQYSIAEIVRLPNLFIKIYVPEYGKGYRSFSDKQRDTINNRLLMYATDVLCEDGTLIYDFIGASDVHLQIENGDTVGYIPQSVIDNAREQIESLYAQERYDEIYELFHTAFVFYPCTGEEYKQIVANGEN